MTHKLVVLAVAAGLAAGSSGVAAQASSKTAQATRIQGDRPDINGRLDEAVWSQAIPIADFVQRSPVEGAEPFDSTIVYIMYDESALYIGARMHSDDPANIHRPVTRRDGFSNAELITVSLDTYLDRRTGYSFSVTAAGVRSDTYHSQDNEHRGQQRQYNPVWHAAAQVDSAGWTAEMRIPYSQLRFTAADEQHWGMNIRRWTPAKNSGDYWVMVPLRETGFISRFGSLVGLEGVQPPARVEILPYVAGDATTEQRAPNDPFDQVVANRVGMDAKIGIGSNLTLDLTVNPDFGQVEADPAEVNLTAFETFFDERRPFFIEGNELLTGQGPDYYYSRRIGARPHGSASGDFVDRPDNTTIAGSAKLTGRLASGTSIGALFAVTPEEMAETFDLTSGQFNDVSVEPFTGFGVIRLQQEIGQTQSTVGGTLTGMRRSFSSSSGLTSALHREAYSGGSDFRYRWADGMYELTGYGGFSHVAGDPAALAITQARSTHYFQRPDADHVTFDPTRTSLSGYAASIRADKNAGRHTLWGAQVSVRSPGFELNDLGRFRSADAIDYNADIQIRDTQPSRLFRDWRVGTVVRGGWNYGGDMQSLALSNNTNFTFHNFWRLNFGVTRRFRAQSQFLTRGGPSMGTPSEWSFNGRLNNSFSASTRWRVNGRHEFDELGGKSTNFGGGITVRPAPSWQLSLDPNYNRSINARQYVRTIAGGGANTFGNRYVFGFIERSTLSARLRLDYAFSPNLTIEGYAEPFAASGRYYDLGELEAARSRELRTYGTDGTSISRDQTGTFMVTDGADSFTINNPDFNVLSFRSNLVMRWEWLPGSTFFLVWQQNRSAFDRRGELVGLSAFGDAVRASGDNFFAMKISYWFAVN